MLASRPRISVPLRSNVSPASSQSTFPSWVECLRLTRLIEMNPKVTAGVSLLSVYRCLDMRKHPVPSNWKCAWRWHLWFSVNRYRLAWTSAAWHGHILDFNIQSTVRLKPPRHLVHQYPAHSTFSESDTGVLPSCYVGPRRSNSSMLICFRKLLLWQASWLSPCPPSPIPQHTRWTTSLATHRWYSFEAPNLRNSSQDEFSISQFRLVYGTSASLGGNCTSRLCYRGLRRSEITAGVIVFGVFFTIAGPASYSAEARSICTFEVF